MGIKTGSTRATLPRGHEKDCWDVRPIDPHAHAQESRKTPTISGDRPALDRISRGTPPRLNHSFLGLRCAMIRIPSAHRFALGWFGEAGWAGLGWAAPEAVTPVFLFHGIADSGPRAIVIPQCTAAHLGLPYRTLSAAATSVRIETTVFQHSTARAP